MYEEEFPPDDRRLFQLLIDYQLEPVEQLAKVAGETNLSMFFHHINSFCDKYNCSSQIQILNWELIGLKTFFILTEKPIEHPYAVRQFEILADIPRYLIQFVAPDMNQVQEHFSELFQIEQIYRPTNNIGLLYEEERTIGFVDEWLLNLKEVMVETGIGDIIYEPDDLPLKPLIVSRAFLEQLGELHVRDDARRFDTRLSNQVRFIKDRLGFLSTYLTIKIPDMIDYILILDKIENPKLFVGGFLGKFPLLELYESPNALICRLQIPEPHFSKFNLTLFTHLHEICFPCLWLLLTDTRMFHLQTQWEENEWIPFKL